MDVYPSYFQSLIDLDHIIIPDPKVDVDHILSPTTKLRMSSFTPFAVLMANTHLSLEVSVGHVSISNLRVNVIPLFSITTVSSPSKSSITPKPRFYLANQFQNLTHSVFPSRELCHLLPIPAKTY